MISCLFRDLEFFLSWKYLMTADLLIVLCFVAVAGFVVFKSIEFVELNW